MIEQSSSPVQVSNFGVKTSPSVACVIPTYHASATIVSVVEDALLHADTVVVVDDCCPQGSGNVVLAAFPNNARIHVVFRSKNGGVGAATKDGIAKALDIDAEIIVKLDADGQMDASYISDIRRIFSDDPSTVCVKGNRFFDESVLHAMPKLRFVGNAVLSLLAKLASGYWNAIDPTNGYLAFNARLLKALPWQKFADSYFFEMSVISELGLKRLPLVELEMPTIYTGATSSLSIRRVMLEFPPKLLRLILRRVMIQYFLFDLNLASIYLLTGLPLLLFGLTFGTYEWIDGVVTRIARPTGTVMLAVLPFLMGFQLILNALMYDVQFSAKTQHELKVSSRRRFVGNRHERDR